MTHTTTYNEVFMTPTEYFESLKDKHFPDMRAGGLTWRLTCHATDDVETDIVQDRHYYRSTVVAISPQGELREAYIRWYFPDNFDYEMEYSEPSDYIDWDDFEIQVHLAWDADDW